MDELENAGAQTSADTTLTELFQIRVIGWRPVGASPILSPEYVREFSINVDAEQHETRWFDRMRLTEDVRDLVHGANYIARYDGFYVADILLNANEFKKRQNDFSNAQMQEQFLNDVSSQVGMIIKEKLGHPHYFHNYKSDSANRKNTNIAAVWLWSLVSAIVAVVGFMTWESPTTIQALIWLLVVAGTLAVSAAEVLFAFKRRVGTLSVDNIDRMLSVHPVRLDDESLQIPINQLPLNNASWLRNLHARKPEDALHSRKAIGQLRRGFLRVAEQVTARMSLVKQRSGPLRRRLTQAFWLGFSILLTTAVVQFLATLVMPAYPIALWGIFIAAMAGYTTLTGFVFILIILEQDLPRVKLLRATHGFFAAANPINEAIKRIEMDALHSADEQDGDATNVAENTRAQQHIEVQNFSDLIKSFEIKLDGESQRLQIKQFWVTSCAALVGGLVTALVFFMQHTSDQEDHDGVPYSCEISYSEEAAAMLKECLPT